MKQIQPKATKSFNSNATKIFKSSITESKKVGKDL